MAKQVDKIKGYGRQRHSSSLAVSSSKHLTQGSVPNEQQTTYLVQVKKAVAFSDGCICNVEILSGGVTTGQEWAGAECPSGMMAAGDRGIMVLRDGEAPLLTPAGGTTAAAEEAEESATQWSPIVWYRGQ